MYIGLGDRYANIRSEGSLWGLATVASINAAVLREQTTLHGQKREKHDVLYVLVLCFLNMIHVKGAACTPVTLVTRYNLQAVHWHHCSTGLGGAFATEWQ